MQRKHKRAGQALVEFALFITLIFTLLSVVIDFGLAFFAYQGIAGAAQEGASFGGLKGGTTDNDAELRLRAATEGGAGSERPSFVDLQDLNNDDQVDDAATRTAWIDITSVRSQAATTAVSGPPVTCGRRVLWCDIVVTVRYNYKPIFALAATLGQSEITLSATRQMLISR